MRRGSLALGFMVAGCVAAFAQQNDALDKALTLHWIKSPTVADLSYVAQIDLDGGLMALNGADSNTFIQLNGNPPSPGTYVVSAPDFRWFSTFAFDPSGYVKDDEKIDSDALLATLKQHNVENLKQRRELGLPLLTLDGWLVPPHYDKITNRLEWGTQLHDESGTPTVNYSVRILGRRGVMRAVLVSEPDSLQADLSSFNEALNGFRFVPGEKYSEFKVGDKVAEYGLAALVLGGAAAVATKAGSGFLKMIGIGILALIASVASFFKRLFRRDSRGPVA